MNERKRSKIVFFMTVSIILAGFRCNQTKENLEGLWYIQKATLNERDAIYQEFTSRNISFLIDGSCVLPNPFRENYTGSKWSNTHINGQNCIKIISKTPYFNDVFYIDTLLPKKVVMKNDSKYILMTKVY